MTRKPLWILLALLLGLAPRAWAQGGQLAANGDTAKASLADPSGGRYASATITLTGTWSGTVSFFHSEDAGLTWNVLNVIRESDGARVTTATANGSFDVGNPGYGMVEAVASSWASGSAAVRITGGAGAVNIPVFAGSVSASITAPANNPIFVEPSDGTNAQTFHQADADTGAGTVNRIFVGLFAPGSGGPQVIPGDSTNGLKVQCASGCSGGTTDTDDGSIAAGQSTGLSLGLLNAFNGATWARVTFGQTTMANSLPVAIASNQTLPLPTGASTSANQSTEITSLSSIDGKLPAAAALANATANPTVTKIGAFPHIFNGTTWDRWTGAVTQSGIWTVQPGNAANTTAWLVTGTGGTFPATQSGTWNFRLQDGSGNAITSDTRGLERPLSVQILDGSGNQVTSFGGSGGTASNFGSAFPSAGTAVGFKDSTGANMAAGNLDASGNLKTLSVGAITPADAFANPTTAVTSWSLNGCWNGTTWDRCKSATLGNGTNTNAQLVTMASDSTGVVGLNAGTNNIGKVDVLGNGGAAFDAATGAAPAANALQTAGLTSGATGGLLKIPTVCDQDYDIDITTATTTLAVTGVSGRKVHVCSLVMVATATDTVALIEGTGATCGTGTAGVIGSSTAGHGMAFAANGGVTLNGGTSTVLSTATTGDSLCIVTSAATQLAGHVKFAIY